MDGKRRRKEVVLRSLKRSIIKNDSSNGFLFIFYFYVHNLIKNKIFIKYLKNYNLKLII